MTTTAAPLTDRQAEVLAAIRAYWRDHGRPPALRDLMALLRISSPNGVVCHLKSLHKKGLVELAGDKGPHGRALTRGIWPAGLRGRIRELLNDTPGSES
jgi:repressor LexA